MLATLLIDLMLTACLGCGPYCASPATPCCSVTAPTPCACPKDSPCKKGCEKGACCCKGTSASCPTSNGLTLHCNSGAGCCSAVPSICAPAPLCCPYTGQPCPMPAMAHPMPPVPPGCACVYEVELKVGKDASPKFMVPTGGGVFLQHLPDSPKCEGTYQIGVHITDAGCGCVKVELQLASVRAGFAGLPTMQFCKGSKTVHLDTPTNMLLSCEDPEPCSVGLYVKSVDVATMTPPAPMVGEYCPGQLAVPPMHHPMPPAPGNAPAFVVGNGENVVYPTPVSAPTPAVTPLPPMCIPEPLAMPTPVAPVVQCVAITAAKDPSAHFKLVRCCHKSVVGMKCDAVAMTGTRMTIDKGTCGTVTVAAGQKYVHVRGKKWKAQADAVEVRADGHIVLTGHVKLVSEKIGVCASVKADKLCVEVKDGQFIGVGTKE